MFFACHASFLPRDTLAKEIHHRAHVLVVALSSVDASLNGRLVMIQGHSKLSCRLNSYTIETAEPMEPHPRRQPLKRSYQVGLSSELFSFSIQ